MEDLLRTKIANMTNEDLVEGMFRDTLTRVWNRRAFEQTPDSAFVALVDVDSLKWVNDNHGHRAGDNLLYRVAQALENIFPDRVFRVSGDEFVIRSDDYAELLNKLSMGRCFSFGVGANLVQADEMLRTDKAQREKTGQRAIRGEEPPYMKD